MKVTLAGDGRSFVADPNEPVLEAALRAGINLPHSCKGGNCSSSRPLMLRPRQYEQVPPLHLCRSSRPARSAASSTAAVRSAPKLRPYPATANLMIECKRVRDHS